MSAVVGQDWRPKTYRELFIQYQAILLESWSHTASLQAIHSTKKNLHISDLHPYMNANAGRQSKGAVVPTTGLLGNLISPTEA